MKCPNCGAEVREEDKFCRENLRREIEIAPKWKWRSMAASLVLVFIFFCWLNINADMEVELVITLLIFGFPATIYLMYKERIEKIKYGLAWILFPILTLLIGLTSDPYHSEESFFQFLWLAIPAIVIDVIYVYKTR